jgi:acyl-CoA synthetase (AMP-forming)/AMP-acid ligase II
MRAAQTLGNLLLEVSGEKPGSVAFGFLPDGEDECVELTYAELATQARRVASLLADRLAPGSRAILVYPPGLEFIAAFFGCQLAGVVPVPAYPPAPLGLDASVMRLRRIAADSGAEVVLTMTGYLAFRDATPQLASAVDVPWLVTDRRRAGDADAWRDPGLDPSTLAMIQYTSGSTADPKGVALRHANLIANQRAIQRAMDSSDRTVGVSWLPMYHDMGLIGFVIHPLFLGIPSYLMSPVHFLERPVRWLRAISRFRATISGAPNFAYELCVKRVTDQEKAGLDLSSWRTVFTGSEHVRAAPLRRFAKRFADCGLRADALYPCYGLAEASLLVAGSVPDRGLRTVLLDGRALGEGIAAQCGHDHPRRVEVTSSGTPPAGHEVVIVTQEPVSMLPEGRVGEIWVRGPSIADGYWNRPGETVSTFGATLPGRGAEPFLRTGDLGFTLDGHLYVTGRAKEVMIVRGRNVYPQDVEVAAQEADSRLRAGCGAAFAIEADGQEEVVLVQEVSLPASEAGGAALAGAREQELQELLRAIRQAVSDAQGIRLAAIALVPPRSMPRTSSGKLMRVGCRAAYLAAEIAPLAQWRDMAVAGA